MNNNIKEGQTYICTNSGVKWLTEGKEYKIIRNSEGILSFIDDEEFVWTVSIFKGFNDTFKLKDERKQLILDYLKQPISDKQTFTLSEINEVLTQAYKMYKNDPQRLAFLKGYFAKYK